MKNMIFHIPFAINPLHASGTNVRPLLMIEAFKSLGYNVYIIMGLGKERKIQIKKIKAAIANGLTFDFMYTESATLPTLLTEPNHFPSYPLLDFSFFLYCNRNRIPIGLFYRDIYWNFNDYKLKGIKAFLTKCMYQLDLWVYQRTLSTLFLPSLEMLNHIPFHFKGAIKALPPGHNIKSIEKTNSLKADIQLLYVGGIGNHYQMSILFDALPKLSHVTLTICTRKKDWEMAISTYDYLNHLPQNVSIVHQQSEELISLYKQADITLLFVEPLPYWKFAVPIKLFEYLGYHRPIIASHHTFAANFIKNNDIGWVINYDETSFINCILEIQKNKGAIQEKKQKMETISKEHTWVERARTVIETLQSN